jgi:hypothetical protein
MATTGNYYALPGTGTIQQQGNSVLAFALKQAGWAGPFSSLAAAHTYLNGTPQQQVKNVPGQLYSATTAVPDFLSRLTSGALWIRVAEVAVGLLLIAVGIAELTKAVPLATKIASVVR